MVKNKHIYAAKIIDFKFIIIFKKKKKKKSNIRDNVFQNFHNKIFQYVLRRGKKNTYKLVLKKKWYNFSPN